MAHTHDHAKMEGVPPHLDLDDVARAMVSVNDVESVHDLHVWTIGSNACALSAHVRITDMRRWPPTLDRIKDMPSKQFELTHTTLQPETTIWEKCDECSCGPEFREGRKDQDV